MWKNNKEVKEDLKNPTIYFSMMAFATNEEPENLLARISHKWHRRGGIMLKVKDLQSFDGDTIYSMSLLVPTRKPSWKNYVKYYPRHKL